jgi:hypothetical protein
MIWLSQEAKGRMTMIDTRFSFTRSYGWTRLGLPGAVAILFGTPMLWALGTFDATAEPLLHAVIFGLSGIFFFTWTPFLLGWALQGFVIRRKAAEDGDDELGGHHPAGARGPASAPAARGKQN